MWVAVVTLNSSNDSQPCAHGSRPDLTTFSLLLRTGRRIGFCPCAPTDGVVIFGRRQPILHAAGFLVGTVRFSHPRAFARRLPVALEGWSAEAIDLIASARARQKPARASGAIGPFTSGHRKLSREYHSNTSRSAINSVRFRTTGQCFYLGAV